jgi:hypothetical protein
MDLGRISVALSAVIFGGFVLAFLFWPAQMATFVNIQLPTPEAFIDSVPCMVAWRWGWLSFLSPVYLTRRGFVLVSLRRLRCSLASLWPVY